MSENVFTETQLGLARHALGLPNGRRRSYRNHFVTGAGSPDHSHWMAMVDCDFARRRGGSPLSGGDDIFWLTRAGAEAALQKGESLCPEDFPKAERSHG